MADASLPLRPKPLMSLLDCLGIGVNGIIGTGIFITTATVWRQAGGKAPWAWLLVGGVCMLVALCFAEAAARTEKSGGPYRYACDTFGPRVGFAVGWITLLSAVLGYAAVARAFGQHVATELFHMPSTHALYNIVSIAVSGGLVVFLMGVHLVGLRFGTKTGSLVSLVKFLSLLVFVAVGLFFVKWSHFSIGPAPLILDAKKGLMEETGLFAAAFTSLFALTGVEYASVPAGEVRNPRRNIPLSLVLSVALTMVLYIVLQVVVIGTLPNQAAAEPNALVQATRQFGGQKAAYAMQVAYAISIFGYCSASVLVGPRYLELFAQDGFLPTALARRSKRGIPVAATVTLTAIVLIFLGMGENFNKLADLSNIGVVAQYIITCIAVLLHRRRGPAPAGAFVIPGGPLVPLLALGGCVALLCKVGIREWLITGIAMVIGLLLGFGWKSAKRK